MQKNPVPADQTREMFKAVEPRPALERALDALNRLPPFSPVLNRLMGELVRESASFAKMAELIESDAVLAGNVLRVVNSPLYGLRSTVNSVRHAISVLGLAQLRNIVLGLSVARLWSNVRGPAGWSVAHFNRHAVAVAQLSDLIAVELDIEYAEGAFTAGLLHDIGKLLIAVSFPSEYLDIDQLAGSDWRKEMAFEELILGFRHAELSAAALERWDLPAPIREAVARHHGAPDGDRSALAGVVDLADTVANELGHGSRAAVAAFGDAMETLAGKGLADEAARLLSEFDRTFGSIRQFF